MTSVYMDDRLEHALRLEKENGGVVHQLIEDITVSLPLTSSTAPTCPTSFLWGTPDVVYPLESYGKRFKEVFGQAQHTVLDDCGHAPQLECSDQVATELARTISSKQPATSQLGSRQPASWQAPAKPAQFSPAQSNQIQANYL